MEINPIFIERMKEYLPDEFEQFEKSLEDPFLKSLRINLKKADPEKLIETFHLNKPSQFCKEGWIVEGSYGLFPEHIQGLYYLQEPSASGVVEALHVNPDSLVLDLCAAPGSKTTQILAKLQTGFLLCNEVIEKRSRILLSNLERMGAVDFCLCSSQVKPLCEQVESCFDRVLVDAPCSGEGMIKKHEKAIDQWNPKLVEECSIRQKQILSEAYKACKRGGELVYSTCTYSLEENEQVVAWFLEHFPEMELIDCEVPFGRKGFETAGMDASLVRRIFPMDGGEGHFIARFRKMEGEIRSLPYQTNQKLPKLAKEFLEEQLDTSFAYYQILSFGKDQKIFAMNCPFIKIKGIIRQGLYLGEIRKNRFEPEHAFFLSDIFSRHAKKLVETTFDQMDQYLHGAQIPVEGKKGFVGLSYQGIPYGFGKIVGNTVKNKYPKGLRLSETSHLKTVEEK